jgi:hypothetical protein
MDGADLLDGDWREKEGPTKIEPKPNWTPFTAFGSQENSSRVKRDIKLDLPTPGSPSKITGKRNNHILYTVNI